MFANLTSAYHLHPIVDHFTIALLACGIGVELLAAASKLLARPHSGRLSQWTSSLERTALLLMIAGAAAAVLSYFTGDAEADRLWDTMSPAAQRLLASSDGASHYLSHAVLGQYLMYAFVVLAGWRILIEISARLSRTRIAYLMVAALAAGALLYQGKTGGELVYEHAVGISAHDSLPASSARE